MKKDIKKEEKTTGGKTLTGRVVSNLMQNTAIVSVERYIKTRKYGKYVRVIKKYAVHSIGDSLSTGDKVVIKECRPISKTKKFTIVN